MEIQTSDKAKAQVEKTKILKTKLIVFVGFLSILFAISFCFYRPIENMINGVNLIGDANSKIHFVDVGMGDAIILQLPDDKVMLIDTGDVGDNLENYLNRYFSDLKFIDYLVLTHPDSDHIGGAIKIVKKYDVGVTYRPKILSSSEDVIEGYAVKNDREYNDLISQLFTVSDEVLFSSAGIVITGEDYEIKFLAPTNDFYTEDNDYSPIIKYQYKDMSVLLTGDASQEIESAILNRDISADILKLGHHGSKTSSSYDFLVKVNPTYVVVSVEAGVYSNLPSREVFNRLDALGVKEENIYRTDLKGSIVFGFDDGIKTWTIKSADSIYIKLYYIIILVVILSYTIIFQSNLGQKR